MEKVLLCSLTNQPCITPILNTKTGHIYEASAIKAYLARTKICPFTSVEVNFENDFIEVRPFQGPTLGYHRITSPFDTVNDISKGIVKVGEGAQELREAAQKLKNKLEISLQKQEAALQIIRNIKDERDNARAMLVKIHHTQSEEYMAQESSDGWSDSLRDEISMTAIRLNNARKETAKNQNKEIFTSETFKGLDFRRIELPHGVHTFDAELSKMIRHPYNSSLVLNSSKESTHLFDFDLKKTFDLENRIFKRYEHIAASSFLSDDEKLGMIAASNDGTIRADLICLGEGRIEARELFCFNYASRLNGLAEHPLQTHFAFLSENSKLSLFDIESQRICGDLSLQFEGTLPTCISMHPDGKLVFLGTDEGVKIVDISSLTVLPITLPLASPHSLRPSENGYNLMNLTKCEKIEIFDLRKIGNSEAKISIPDSLVCWADWGKAGNQLLWGRNSGDILSAQFGEDPVTIGNIPDAKVGIAGEDALTLLSDSWIMNAEY